MIDEPRMLASGAGGKLRWTAASILLTVVLLTLGSSWAGGEYAFGGVVVALAGLAVALVAFAGRHQQRGQRLPAWLWPTAAVACASMNLMPALLFPNPLVTAGATVVLLGCVLALGTGPLEGRRWLALEVGIGADLALAATKMKWGKGELMFSGLFKEPLGSCSRGTIHMWPGIRPRPTSRPSFISRSAREFSC